MELSEKIGIPEIYKYYKETLIYQGKRFRSKRKIFLEQHRFIIDRQLFSNILKDFNLELARLMIEDNIEFRMPANMGTVRIRKYKLKIRYYEDGTIDPNSINVDWDASKKLWAKLYPGKNKEELKLIKGKQVVYHLNEHTEGYIFRLYWNKQRCALKNRRYYSVMLTRANKRRIAELVKTDSNTNYYE